MCNRATLHDVANIMGSSPEILVVVIFQKNLAAIPSVGYRKIILLGRTRSHDVVQRHITI